MLKNSFEDTVFQIWETMEGGLVEKLEGLREGLKEWEKGIKDKRNCLKKQLSEKLERLV